MENPIIARYFDLVQVATDKLGPGWPNSQDLARGVQEEIDAMPEGSRRQEMQEIHAKFVKALVGEP